MNGRTGVGEALRSARIGNHLSLSDVASQAGVSVATLSRIENEKQSIDVTLLVRLSAIVGVAPATVLTPENYGHDKPTDLARELASRTPAERAQILIRATKHGRRPNRKRETVQAQIDSLLAAIDLIVEEINELQKKTRR